MEGRRPAAHQVAPLEEHTAGRRPAHQNPGRQSSLNRTFSQTNWADIVAGHQHKVKIDRTIFEMWLILAGSPTFSDGRS